MSGTEMYYIVEDGKKEDAALHEPMLDVTPKEVLDDTKALAREMGFTEEEIIRLYGK